MGANAQKRAAKKGKAKVRYLSDPKITTIPVKHGAHPASRLEQKRREYLEELQRAIGNDKVTSVRLNAEAVVTEGVLNALGPTIENTIMRYREAHPADERSDGDLLVAIHRELRPVIAARAPAVMARVYGDADLDAIDITAALVVNDWMKLRSDYTRDDKLTAFYDPRANVTRRHDDRLGLLETRGGVNPRPAGMSEEDHFRADATRLLKGWRALVHARRDVVDSWAECATKPKLIAEFRPDERETLAVMLSELANHEDRPWNAELFALRHAAKLHPDLRIRGRLVADMSDSELTACKLVN